MTITPSTLAMEGDSTLYYEFLVAGAPAGSGFAVTLVTTGKAAIPDPDEYGTVDPAAGNFDAQSTASFEFNPADITGAYKSFRFSVEAAAVDGAENNGLDVLYSGIMRIFPLAEFSGEVVDEQNNLLVGVEVRALLGSETMAGPIFTKPDGTFSFSVADPATIGQEYAVIFAADGFVAQVVTTEGWVNPEVIRLAAEIQGLTISGTVKSGGLPVAGARVESTLDDQDLLSFTDAGGNYTLSLPRALAQGEVLIARASKLGYVAAEQNIVQTPNFVLTLQSGGQEQDVCEAGGTFEWDSAIVEIPAGALDDCYTIEVTDDIAVGTDSLYTEKSVVLVQISISGVTMPLAEPIIVTIPYDMNEVEPADFVAGRAIIYHAPTENDLRNGTNLKKVATADIITQDPLNGLVTFRVSTLSIFGVGGAQAASAPIASSGGGGGGGCFIDTVMGASGWGWFASLLLTAFAAGVAVITRVAK
jgi:hypothetical protein